MDWAAEIHGAFLRRGRALDADVLDELAQHAVSLADALRASGLDEAGIRAEIAARIAEWAADERPFAPPRRRRAPLEPGGESSIVAGCMADLRYGLRVLAGEPGHTLLAVLTIAVGIGAVTVMANLVWGVLLGPLPWPDAERLVRVCETRQGSPSRFGPIVTNVAFLAWRDGPRTIDGLAAWTPSDRTLTDTHGAERIRVAAVTASLGHVLRASPALGRWLLTADEATGRRNVVVLSHGLWRERLAGDPAAVGKTIRLDGRLHTIVGVMPEAFSFPDRGTRAWVPFAVTPPIGAEAGGLNISMFSAIARLRDGVTPLQAAAEATSRGRSFERELGLSAPDGGLTVAAIFAAGGPLEVTLVPAREAATRDVGPALLMLLAAVGLLLAVSAANVANLQLARTGRRRRELAIRGALGATAGRLTRQLLVENALLGLAGGTAGLLLAASAHRLLPHALPADFPRLDELVFGWRAAAVALGAALAASLVFGALPALVARRTSLTDALAEDALAPSGGGLRLRTARLRALVMVAQVAAATVLLAAAALLTSSFLALLEADRGFDRAPVLTAALPMPDALIPDARKGALLEDIVERLERVPGVTAAGFTSILPLTDSQSIRAFTMPPRAGGSACTTDVQAGFRVVSAGYFAALGLDLTEGRGFLPEDSETSRPVVVVNRAFARAYLDDTPLGEVVPLGPEGLTDWHVVGVVEDVRSPYGAAAPEMFVLSRQWPEVPRGVPTIVLRAAGHPAGFAPVLRSIVHDLDPGLAVTSVLTMEERLQGLLAHPRLYAMVLNLLAASALLIAGVGLYGVLSYTLAQRSRELAVRAAVGASPARIAALVVRQAMGLVTAGLVVGGLVSTWATGLLSAQLHGVAPGDPLSHVAASALVAAVALAACAVPAWRAARLEPLTLLRRP
jgi:putative ABC transport system permease protein